MLEGLSSNSFKLYSSTLEKIRDTLDEGKTIEIDEESFRKICGIYHLYTWSHDDIVELQKQVLDLLMKHKTVLMNDDEYKHALKGIATYTLGHLDGRYDPSGFFTYVTMGFLGASLEMCARIEVEKIEEFLQNDFPVDANIFKKYKELLDLIEESCHLSYWILRHIGNKYLETLLYITVQIEPIFKSFVLHALDEFVGDEDVINFYKRYIDFFEDVKNASDKEVVHQECDALIKEAQEYLDRVQK